MREEREEAEEEAGRASAIDSFPPGARRVPRVPSRSRLCSTVARPTQPEKIALKEDLG